MTGLANWDNRTLFHGDNLKFLRAMNSESVDLIATDPPFNKNKDFHATPDSLSEGASFQDRWSWERDVHQEWVDQITDDFPKVMNVIECSRNSYGDNMGAFLCFMAVRLLEMHRVLKRNGAIYLHCDPTASHYLKALMDSIFGRKNFLNEIVWHYTGGGRSKTYFSKKHDLILYYVKSSKEYTFNVDSIRIPYKETSGYAKGGITAKSGKHYMPHPDGTPIDDVWDIPIINPMDKKERVGYPTQKPLVLYERIILASSNKNDIVLDPFAGCATTLVAAERKNRQWVGIDIWDDAKDIILERLAREYLIGEGVDRRTLLDKDVHFITEPPIRTDERETAAPHLQVRLSVNEPYGPRMSRAEMYQILLSRQGKKCQGCDRVFDDARYLELDHNTPRSDGGINHISNRILLCSPCNRLKSNTRTLTGLRRENGRLGYMVN